VLVHWIHVIIILGIHYETNTSTKTKPLNRNNFVLHIIIKYHVKIIGKFDRFSNVYIIQIAREIKRDYLNAYNALCLYRSI